MAKVILIVVGLLLFISLFSEESARALAWLRTSLKRSPRYRVIVYPLLLILLVLMGLLIANSLINLATGPAFSYD